MNTKINLFIKFFFLSLFTTVVAPTLTQAQLPTCDVLLDDFSGASLDLDDWESPEASRYLSGGKLVISQKFISRSEKSTFLNFQRLDLDFADGVKDDIEAKIAITEANLSASGKGSAFASIRGSYYSIVDNGPDNQIGDIYASVQIGERGNGLEAWYEIYQAANEEFTEWTTLADQTIIAPGILQLNTEYDARIQLLPPNQFRFTVNGVTATFNGPAPAVTPEFISWRRLTAGAVPKDSGDSDTISVVASFDDIKDDGVLFDSFSGSEINHSKWNMDKAHRYIVNGKLRNIVRSQVEVKVNLHNYLNISTHGDAACLQATLNLQSSSTMPDGTRGRVRLEGYWYNSKNSSATGYNRLEDNVWAQLVLQKDENGDMYAYAYAENIDDADYNNYTPLIDQGFNTPLSLDTDYVAVINLDRENKRLQFRFGNEVINMPITTQMAPAWPDKDYVGILTRPNKGPGEIHSLIDNVYVSPSDYVDPDYCDFYVIGKIVVCL